MGAGGASLQYDGHSTYSSFDWFWFSVASSSWIITDIENKSDDNPNEDGNQNAYADPFTAMTRASFGLSSFDLVVSRIDILLVDLCTHSRLLFSMGIFFLVLFIHFFNSHLNPLYMLEFFIEFYGQK